VLIVHDHFHLANEVEVFDAKKTEKKNLFLYKLMKNKATNLF
jgi:hypothetical protein